MDGPASIIGKKLKCGEYAYIEFLALLGTGASGAVYRVRRTVLNPGLAAPKVDLLAAKVIDVRQLNLSHRWDREREKLRREVKILATMSHSGVVNLHGVIDTNDWLVLLMDLVEGGELFTKVARGPMQEERARYVFIQIATTLKFLHGEGIIHRDLKLENVLVEKEVTSEPGTVEPGTVEPGTVEPGTLEPGTLEPGKPEPGTLEPGKPEPNGAARGGFYQVRVADFGLSKAVAGAFTVARSYVGTPQYWAPEVILAGRNQGSYSFSADLWSLGCLLFILVSGRYPFECEYDWENDVLKGNYTMADEVFDTVSEGCKDIIKGLLRVKPEERMTLEQVMKTDWFKAPCQPPLPELKPLHRAPIHMNLGPLFIGASAQSMEVEEIPSIPPASAPAAPADPQTPLPPAVATVGTLPLEAMTATERRQEQRKEGYRASVRQLFNATEMLELLVSVFYRFHQAYIVFRSNPQVALRIQSLLVDIKELTLATRKAFQSIGLTCGAVIELLDDIRLCVEDGKPEAALEMFDNLQSWVQEVLEEGNEVRKKYLVGLQHASALVQATRDMPATFTALSPIQMTLGEKAAVALESQIQKREFLDQSAEPQDLLDFLFVPTQETGFNAVEISSAVSMGDGTERTPDHTKPPTVAEVIDDHGAKIAPVERKDVPAKGKSHDEHNPNDLPDNRNQQLDAEAREGEAREGEAREGEAREGEARDDDTRDGDTRDGDTRDVNKASGHDKRTGEEKRTSEEQRTSEDNRMGEDKRMGEDLRSSVEWPNDEQQLVPVSNLQATPQGSGTTESYVRQTALLMRGLRELQRVANMLEESTTYWDNLSVALSLVQKFRDQTFVLLKHASGSKRQEQRLLERVAEYEAFWEELAKQTSTFVEGSRRSGESMRKFVNTFNESIVRTNALAEYYNQQRQQGRQLL
ncbi:protein kinase [Gregarina niphandrodes]|uniref:Protein kinase n=1 Tax=Gregarina niphandrodes TaxID=110365 RepID=A0A023BD89_GRENI|nr:protein kinase [Gregarina niphandrodes]EZG87458.1 protein kinase [Gregarina niphandrodes]|eukprot:XP_011128663.1 protein kinase [Gregarina niphandrodes]